MDQHNLPTVYAEKGEDGRFRVAGLRCLPAPSRQKRPVIRKHAKQVPAAVHAIRARRDGRAHKAALDAHAMLKRLEALYQAAQAAQIEIRPPRA